MPVRCPLNCCGLRSDSLVERDPCDCVCRSPLSARQASKSAVALICLFGFLISRVLGFVINEFTNQLTQQAHQVTHQPTSLPPNPPSDSPTSTHQPCSPPSDPPASAPTIQLAKQLTNKCSPTKLVGSGRGQWQLQLHK